METIQLKVDIKNIGKPKVLLAGQVKEIVVNKYYDLDGQIINEGQDTTKFEEAKDFEITKQPKKMYDYKFDDWSIKVNGEKFDTGWELTGYKLVGDRLVLRACTGAG